MSDHSTSERLTSNLSKMTIVVEDDADNGPNTSSSSVSNNSLVAISNNDEV